MKSEIIKSIKLAKKHPANAMLINGVKIEGYNFKNYALPADTDIESDEVKSWFIIEEALKEEKKAATPKAKAVKSNEY